MNILLVSISPVSCYMFHRKYLGLGYIHAYALADEKLEKLIRIEHDCHDIVAHDPAGLAGKIVASTPDLVGFSCYIWNTPYILQTARCVKELNPEVRILLGGPEVDFEHLRILQENPAVDFISVGEGEKNFRELLHALLEDSSPADVTGVASRVNGAPRLGRRREREKNPDIFPSPYLTGVIEVNDEDRGAFFQTTRGCPFKCGYCAWGREQPYSEFSMERVTAEIEYFKRTPTDAIFCVDSTFNLNNKRAIEILETMTDLGLRSALWFEALPRLLDEPFMEALSKLRLSYMGLGIQTVNLEAMEHINRVWDPLNTGALLDGLARFENCLQGYELIMGLPGDDLEKFKETLDWAYRRTPAVIHVFPLDVLPETPLGRRKEELAIEDLGPDGFHEIVSNYSFSAEQALVGKAMRMWNRVMQQVFFRLTRATGRAAGDLLEQWSWHAYRAGLNDQLAEYHLPGVEWAYMERVVEEFRSFCSKIVPDIALQISEFLRYYHARRKATEGRTNFLLTVDIHGITTDRRLNRIVGKETPRPEDARRLDFAFDMEKLWPMTSLDELKAIAREPHTYQFFTDENGLAVAAEL